MTLKRRTLLTGVAAAATLTSGEIVAASASFGFRDVQDQAQRLAAEPHKPLPLVAADQRKLSYSQYKTLRFNEAETLWRDSKGLFRAGFFPTGFLYGHAVDINIVSEEGVAPLAATPSMFDLSDVKPMSTPSIAGFRINYPLHGPKLDEIGAFLGASYFRLIGREQAYGISARGLAIDTGLPRQEEFPTFRAFWLVTPPAGARSITVYALLDSPGVAGAFQFDIRPGRRTTADITATLFMRHDISLLGIAPLTSMFMAGKTTRPRESDFRPEVHDSDGLLIAGGSGEWIWRPVTNPTSLAVASFIEKNIRGFGLMQRERSYAAYQDLESHYHTRPSFWVEPIGEWGDGEVRLIEIPSQSEANDNLVTFWTPRAPARRGQRMDVKYRLSALSDDTQLSPGAIVTATRPSLVPNLPKQRRVMVEFAGGDLAALRPDQPIEASVTVVGARPVASRVEAVPDQRTWRVFVDVQPDGTKPIDMRVFLTLRGEVLTETWNFTLRQ